MHSLGSRPLIAVSLAIPSIILIGYLWQKRRTEEAEANKSDLNQYLGAIDSREVSLKLESLNRSRLDCIEEERTEVQEDKIVKSLETAVQATCTLVENSSVLTDTTKIITATVEVLESAPELVQTKPEVITVETISEESLAKPPTMTATKVIEDIEVEKKEEVPDVFSALKDPICDLLTSPVKSESLDSQRSCESWSDLIEQDELEKSLCEKLDLSENTRHDSGVASPTDDLSESGRKARDDKSRMSSGEDAGIGGSETGWIILLQNACGNFFLFRGGVEKFSEASTSSFSPSITRLLNRDECKIKEPADNLSLFIYKKGS